METFVNEFGSLMRWLSKKTSVFKKSMVLFIRPSLCFLFFAFSSLITACNSNSSHGPKFTQYYNQGEQLYIKHCSNCHQKNGRGLGRVYPPLDTSDFMDKNLNAVLCLMENGLQGSLIVNGIEFNQRMPGVPTLTDLEVAQIATYIYNTWSHEKGLIDVKSVSPVLRNCE